MNGISIGSHGISTPFGTLRKVKLNSGALVRVCRLTVWMCGLTDRIGRVTDWIGPITCIQNAVSFTLIFLTPARNTN